MSWNTRMPPLRIQACGDRLHVLRDRASRIQVITFSSIFHHFPAKKSRESPAFTCTCIPTMSPGRQVRLAAGLLAAVALFAMVLPIAVQHAHDLLLRDAKIQGGTSMTTRTTLVTAPATGAASAAAATAAAAAAVASREHDGQRYRRRAGRRGGGGGSAPILLTDPPLVLEQTISGLRAQLLATDGYYNSTEDLQAFVRATYAARKIFADRPRANGRLYLEHHMGTASAAMHLRAPMFFVTAAVLHSSFGFGAVGGNGEELNITMLCERRRAFAVEHGLRTEALVFGDSYLPQQDLQEDGIVKLYRGWKAGFLDGASANPAHGWIAALILLNELDEFSSSEMLTNAPYMRRPATAAMVVELLRDFVGSPALADLARWQYDHVSSVLNWTDAATADDPLHRLPYRKRHHALRSDVSPAVARVIAALRDPVYGKDERPKHSTINSVVPAYVQARAPWTTDTVLADWAGYYGAYDRLCCDHGGPCDAFAGEPPFSAFPDAI